MGDEDLLLPRDFGSAARLSPKALRIYAEHGLLVPAFVDPVTGYRRYHRDQIPLGRLIGRLRALDLPLARIAILVALSPQARQAELRAWLAAQEDQLACRRELIGSLDPTGPALDATPILRQRPGRILLSRERSVHIGELDSLISTSAKEIRAHLQAGGRTRRP